MKKFYDINDGKVNFKNGEQLKYYICFNNYEKRFEIHIRNADYGLHIIYFSSEKLTQECLDEIVRPFYNIYYNGKLNRLKRRNNNEKK